MSCTAQIAHQRVAAAWGMVPIAAAEPAQKLLNSNLCAESALYVAMQLLVTCFMRDGYQKTSWLWSLDLPGCRTDKISNWVVQAQQYTAALMPIVLLLTTTLACAEVRPTTFNRKGCDHIS